jgi:hypothetical protein
MMRGSHGTPHGAIRRENTNKSSYLRVSRALLRAAGLNVTTRPPKTGRARSSAGYRIWDGRFFRRANPTAKEHQTTNLGVRSSNLFGRANSPRRQAARASGTSTSTPERCTATTGGTTSWDSTRPSGSRRSKRSNVTSTRKTLQPPPRLIARVLRNFLKAASSTTIFSALFDHRAKCAGLRRQRAS